MRLLLACLALWAHLALGIQPVQVAPDVYVFVGTGSDVTAANHGFVANSGFIIGADGIIVVDTGTSFRHGREMRAAIAKISQRPIRLVVLTHAAQEFIFGAAAFQEPGISILAQRKSAELMRARCATCLARLQRTLGKGYMRGSKVIAPDQLIDGSTTLNVAGREIELHYYGWASSLGDMVVFDRRSGVVFAGGLVSTGRIPDLHDGDLKGWLAALDSLEKLPATCLVPGFGAPVCPADVASTRSYLTTLDSAVRAQYRSGASLLNVSRETPLPAFSHWAMYATTHPRNVQQRFLEVEREEFR